VAKFEVKSAAEIDSDSNVRINARDKEKTERTNKRNKEITPETNKSKIPKRQYLFDYKGKLNQSTFLLNPKPSPPQFSLILSSVPRSFPNPNTSFFVI
jgi:hypothetical protein